MLVDRLVFGCARLTGGAAARAAAALVDQVLTAGVRHFDTAPAYGLGMAEEVIGRATAGMQDVRITAKVGLARPRAGLVLSYVRAAKRRLRPSGRILDQPFEPTRPLQHGPDRRFDATTMAASLNDSLRRLKRERVSVLLLHEAGASDARPEPRAFLDKVRRSGVAEVIGYSHGAMFDPATHTAFPSDFVAQAAIPPSWLEAAPLSPAHPLYLHSIPKTGYYLARSQPRFAKRLDAAVSIMGRAPVDPDALRLAVLFAVAHHHVPTAGLIYATSNPDRAAAFFAALRHMEERVGVHEVLAAIDKMNVAEHERAPRGD